MGDLRQELVSTTPESKFLLDDRATEPCGAYITDLFVLRLIAR